MTFFETLSSCGLCIHTYGRSSNALQYNHDHSHFSCPIWCATVMVVLHKAICAVLPMQRCFNSIYAINYHYKSFCTIMHSSGSCSQQRLARCIVSYN